MVKHIVIYKLQDGCDKQTAVQKSPRRWSLWWASFPVCSGWKSALLIRAMRIMSCILSLIARSPGGLSGPSDHVAAKGCPQICGYSNGCGL